ncbi:MAG: hypothetical protein KIT25_06250 [Enhydrobacter sp.]|nr:MAG: hypothetical protein KIT25_06250 [Enhydrobacter sp.]
MPLQWSVSHPLRLVIAVAKGEVVAQEMLDLLAAIDRDGAQGYRKLFDVTGLATEFADDRVLMLADIVKARGGPAGPIAVVAQGDRVHRQAGLFISSIGPARHVRAFREQHEARAWLDRLKQMH